MFYILIAALAFTANLYAYEYATGTKVSDDPSVFPVTTQEPILSSSANQFGLSKEGTFSDLLPFVFASPHQESGGSCLYMTLTGSVEYWLAKKNPQLSRAKDGPLDLSERYLMNIDDEIDPEEQVNQFTDKIYVVNHAGGFAKNSDYRYTKGYYKKVKGNYVQSRRGARGARYGTSYNWVNSLNQFNAPLVNVPQFDRKVLHHQEGADQWDVGVMPKNTVSMIKEALRENQAPVQIIYNHYGIWHAVMIVGYDDHANSNGCRFTRGFVGYMNKRSKKLKREARRTRNRALRKKKLKKSRYYLKQASTVNKHLRTRGCRQGMFYVRDSIYRDAKNVYDYNKETKNDEGTYSQRVVLRDYEWVEALGNHLFQITVKE